MRLRVQNEVVREWRHNLTIMKIEITAILMQNNVSEWLKRIPLIQ